MATVTAAAPVSVDEATSEKRLATLCLACGHVLRVANAYRLAKNEQDRAARRAQIKLLHRHARKVFEFLWAEGRLASTHRGDALWHMQKADAAYSSVYPGDKLAPPTGAAVAAPAAEESASAEA